MAAQVKRLAALPAAREALGEASPQVAPQEDECWTLYVRHEFDAHILRPRTCPSLNPITRLRLGD